MRNEITVTDYMNGIKDDLLELYHRGLLDNYENTGFATMYLEIQDIITPIKNNKNKLFDNDKREVELVFYRQGEKRKTMAKLLVETNEISDQITFTLTLNNVVVTKLQYTLIQDYKEETTKEEFYTIKFTRKEILAFLDQIDDTKENIGSRINIYRKFKEVYDKMDK